jgi:hypothetical protein
MRTKTRGTKQTISQLRDALWHVEENPKQSWEDLHACVMVLHDCVQDEPYYEKAR